LEGIMPSNDYHFITHWRVKGTVQEVADVIGDVDALVRWWPSVYLDVKKLRSGDEQGVGSEYALYTKGWLPYTLRWNFRVTESKYPYGSSLEAQGDFVGRGIWTYEQDGPWVNVTYDWKIRADKPLLRLMSPIMKPIFSANHRWAMEMGRVSLELELARRRATTPEERALVPEPPGPVTISGLIPRLVPAGAVVIGGAIALKLLTSSKGK
jgi:hypothetical protein